MRLMVLTGLLLVASTADAMDCAFEAPRNLDIDIAGATALEAKLASSDLRIEGVPGLARIEVRGRACASSQEKLNGVMIDQGRAGDTILLTPRQADEQTFGMFGSNYAYLDVKVNVPANLAVRIRSNSGDVDARGLASLDFSSHSGDLSVESVAGALIVDVHSGDVKAKSIGSLDVQHSGSGDIQARGVKKDVHVGRVGSGDLQFTDIGGNVDVESVGSGDVTAQHVGGNMRVGSIGSGDVTAQGVDGDLTVQSTGSGDVHHSGIKGKVSVPKDSDDDD